MIVVADSGSTKCDWLVHDTDTQQEFRTHTMGFNPYFHDADKIAAEIQANASLQELSARVRSVYFYCAGGSSDEMRQIAANGLKRVFSGAHIAVYHDLEGAVRATCGKEKGIACILGTGSNAVYFDGENMIEAAPSLGYILGDEGSGSWFGRRLLKDFLYHRMPEDIFRSFEDTYALDKQEILRCVYRMPHANVFLASFGPFLSRHQQHPYILQVVSEGLREFVVAHVCCFPQHREVPVHFVGSIAVSFREQLLQITGELGCSLGTITREPVNGMMQYHLQQNGFSSASSS